MDIALMTQLPHRVLPSSITVVEKKFPIHEDFKLLCGILLNPDWTQCYHWVFL